MKGLIILLVLLFSQLTFSQNTGLYGKKFAVQVDFLSAYPFFSNLQGDSYNRYKNKSGKLVQGNDNFDYGLNLSGMYATKNNAGIGLEYNINYSSIYAPSYIQRTNITNGFEVYESNSLDHERIKMNTSSVMAKLELTSRNGLLPIGLSHQIGFGLTFTKLVQDDYLYQNNTSPGNEIPDYDEKFYNYDNKSFRGFTFMYALSVRMPVSKRIMISYGLRYTFNFLPARSSENTYNNDDSYWLDKQTAYYLVKERINYTFIKFNIGMAIAL